MNRVGTKSFPSLGRGPAGIAYWLVSVGDTTYALTNTGLYLLIQQGGSTWTPEPRNEISTFTLGQNYPNPESHLPTHVSLCIYDLLGRQVAVLVNEEKPAGLCAATWNAAAFPSGVYFYRLVAGRFMASRKMLLTKWEREISATCGDGHRIPGPTAGDSCFWINCPRSLSHAPYGDSLRNLAPFLFPSRHR